MTHHAQTHLHLALDARTVHAPVRRGTGKNLVDLYSKVLELCPNWTVTGLHRGEDAQSLPHDRYRPSRIDMPGDRFDAWQRWRLPHAAWSAGAHLLHCPANTCPTWNPIPTIVTIHDLLPLDAGGPDAARFEKSVRHAVQHDLTIITPSRFTASQLSDRFHARPSQIIVNAWAPDRGMNIVQDPDLIASVLAHYEVQPPFMLHLGAAQQRKNTHRVLVAYAALPTVLRRQWPLLIVGLDHPQTFARMAQEAQELGVADTVKLHGFADEADMPALFTAADVLVYPSLGEGFGLPILDAFVTHTAVLTSRTTSLPEVGGDAALYVEPTDIDDLRAGMQNLITSDALRRQLTERGLQRVQQFTWDKTAERFIRAVNRAMQHPESRRHAAA
jgi:glycosyltransferase involved in cell wall biosynthesis